MPIRDNRSPPFSTVGPFAALSPPALLPPSSVGDPLSIDEAVARAGVAESDPSIAGLKAGEFPVALPEHLSVHSRPAPWRCLVLAHRGKDLSHAEIG